jgi:hypothetical protein
MIRISEHGEVVRFDVARTFGGRGRYWTSAYLVGNTLIDTGCAHGTSDLLAALGGRTPRAILNTHSHEDHIGAKISYLEDLGGRILDARRKGASVGRIARELCGPPLLLELITLGHFSRRVLVRSFLSGAPERPNNSSAR